MFDISAEKLLHDLYRAYKEARKHKRNKPYQIAFEFELETHLIELRDELINGSYTPGHSMCFLVYEPKMREVFAADFRDRVVHHLFYNYTAHIFQRYFIADSYSCIPGRGTHYGIKRLRHHILSESRNYNLPCWVLRLDIKGYFMSINRNTLLGLARKILAKASDLKSPLFVDYLLYVISTFNPTDDCRIIGEPGQWDYLSVEKSLFKSRPNCGLPIGNLSSQLFSNVYLNELDQYCKRELGCRHYGRYVDDIYVVSSDRDWLKSLIIRISNFIETNLGLKLNLDKTQIYDVRYGVEFLGAYLKPYRTYVSSSTLCRMRLKIRYKYCHMVEKYLASCRGVLCHFASYHLQRCLGIKT